MDNNTTSMLEERLAQLPEDVRNAVLSVEWEGKVQAIGQKHRLHIDQIGTLGDLTLMTMLGLVNLSDYPTRLIEDLKISSTDAEAITKEVGDEVFMPIRESLKKLSSGEHATPAAPLAPATPAPIPLATPVATPIAVVVPPKAPAAAPVPVSINAQTTPMGAPKPAAAAEPAPKPDLSAADALLHATTVTTVATPTVPQSTATTPAGAAQAPKPAAYATDPYREPPV